MSQHKIKFYIIPEDVPQHTATINIATMCDDINKIKQELYKKYDIDSTNQIIIEEINDTDDTIEYQIQWYDDTTKYSIMKMSKDATISDLKIAFCCTREHKFKVEQLRIIVQGAVLQDNTKLLNYGSIKDAFLFRISISNPKISSTNYWFDKYIRYKKKYLSLKN